VSDVNIDEVLVADPVRPPDVVDELAPGESHRWTARQSHEQVPFGGGQGHLDVAQVHTLAVRVDT
jgi:hypothetical protein